MSSRCCWFVSALLLLATVPAAARAPQWLRDQIAVPVAPQEEDVKAVMLLSEVELEVRADGKLRKRVRAAYRVIRADADTRLPVQVVYDARTRVKSMHAWTIPAQGADMDTPFEQASDTAFAGSGSELITDIRSKQLLAPPGRAGAISGYEYEVETTPLALADSFMFQDYLPVVKAHYTLVLPRGWTVTPTWMNHAPVEAERKDDRHWQWTVRDVPAIRREAFMPSPGAIAGRLQVAFARAGTEPELGSWRGIGGWYAQLMQDRLAPTDALRAKVAELTQGMQTSLDRFRALAAFVQSDVRYVAIELGIGGFQPHAVGDVFTRRYGDCKDKVTLLTAMLREAGVDSIPVLVNTDRSEITPQTPPGLLFNHVILAVLLPRDQLTPDIRAVADAPDGRAMVFFDPTDEIAPVGRLAGALQESWGVAATRDGGRLVQLPRVSYRDNGLRRSARLKLDDAGKLSGEFTEQFSGDLASAQRWALRSATRQADFNLPVEKLLATSIAAYRVVSAEAANRNALGLPLEWRYSMEAESYARRSGDLLMVRPRVVGVKAIPVDDKEPRVHDMLLSEARMDQDDILIDLPPGLVVESLPEPVDIDLGFAAYRSRAEVSGSQLKYTRTFELRELRLPAEKVAGFNQLNAAIARDERALVILKRTAK